MYITHVKLILTNCIIIFTFSRSTPYFVPSLVVYENKLVDTELKVGVVVAECYPNIQRDGKSSFYFCMKAPGDMRSFKECYLVPKCSKRSSVKVYNMALAWSATHVEVWDVLDEETFVALLLMSLAAASFQTKRQLTAYEKQPILKEKLLKTFRKPGHI